MSEQETLGTNVEFGGLRHICQNHECHVPGFVETLRRKVDEMFPESPQVARARELLDAPVPSGVAARKPGETGPTP